MRETVRHTKDANTLHCAPFVHIHDELAWKLHEWHGSHNNTNAHPNPQQPTNAHHDSHSNHDVANATPPRTHELGMHVHTSGLRGPKHSRIAHRMRRKP